MRIVREATEARLHASQSAMKGVLPLATELIERTKSRMGAKGGNIMAPSAVMMMMDSSDGAEAIDLLEILGQGSVSASFDRTCCWGH